MKEIGTGEFTVPALDTPAHARFEARIAGTDIVNAWDFWLFPTRGKAKLDTVAVTEDLYDTLSARYDGLVKLGSSEAASASVAIGSWEHPALLEAIGTGKRCIMIGPADGKPNISLGWWALGDQVGTAFAEHPVFGDFPHDGTLSPLWFRLIKRGLPLPIATKYDAIDYLAVGEGQQEYFTYMARVQNAGGQPYLITHGLDLLADTPEGAYLLDQMLAYTQSDAFNAEASQAQPRVPELASDR